MAANYIDIHKPLIDRCKAGDNKAQYEVYSLYARAMYNVCIRIVNHTSEAEDILQESFLEAFTGISSFRADASFGAWLKKIVVNKSINYLNKKKLVLFDQAKSSYDAPYQEYEGDEDIEWDVQRVHRAMHSLPDGYRIVLSLYLLEGYDHAEIAQILDITESTSKSQYSRAKEYLRAQLKKKDHAG